MGLSKRKNWHYKSPELVQQLLTSRKNDSDCWLVKRNGCAQYYTDVISKTANYKGWQFVFRPNFNIKVATCNHDFIWFEKGIPNPQMSLAANDVSFSYQDWFYGFLCDLCVWSLNTSIYFWREKLKWVVSGNFQTSRLVLIT